MDGTALVDQATSEPTVVMDRSQATATTLQPRKRKTGLWIALALLGILLIGGVVGILMFAAYRMGSASAVKVNVNSNTSSTPKAGGTPRATPQSSSTVATTEPTPEGSPDINFPADEPTPITWSTAASTFKTDVGLKYTFQCPADGSAGTVWGSDVYTIDSSICTAAVHAGKLTLEKGGTVTIEITGGRQTYGATTRNGITTYNYGQYGRSFVFRDAGKTE